MKKTRTTTLLWLVFLSFALASCLPTWKTIKSERDRVVDQITGKDGLQERLPKAWNEVSEYSGKYPKHYLTDQSVMDRMDKAERNLQAITTPETGWLAQLNAAVEAKDKKKAKEALDEIDSMTPEIKVIVELILGPPGSPQDGLFAVLDVKVALLKDGYTPNDGRDLFAEIKALDGPTLATIQEAKPFNLCGSQKQMTYSGARGSYGLGLAYYQEAERLSVIKVDAEVSGGMIDLPAVSDKLVEAKASFDAAVGSVVNAERDHQNAVDAIDGAERKQTEADVVRLLNLFAYYRSDSDREYNDGVTAFNNASTYCLSEDFQNALTLANTAKDNFAESIRWAQESAPSSDDDDPTIITIDGGGDSGGDSGGGGGSDYYEDSSDDYYEDSSDDYYEDSSDDYYEDSSDDYYP